MFLSNPLFAWPVPAKFEFKNMEAVTVHVTCNIVNRSLSENAPSKFAMLMIFEIT